MACKRSPVRLRYSPPDRTLPVLLESVRFFCAENVGCYCCGEGVKGLFVERVLVYDDHAGGIGCDLSGAG